MARRGRIVHLSAGDGLIVCRRHRWRADRTVLATERPLDCALCRREGLWVLNELQVILEVGG